jgi:hypothetical protein
VSKLSAPATGAVGDTGAIILASCPFLAGHTWTFPERLERVKVGDYWWHVECVCGARGPRGDDSDVAALRWNER